MPNVRQKHPSQLAFRRGGRGRGLTVPSRPPGFVAPPPPEGIGPAGREAWRRFWSADVSAAVDVNADLVDLENWARAVDERACLRRIVEEAPMVRGSSGALVLNPLYRRIRELSDEIQRASDRFGMNPTARWRLQFAVSETSQSIIRFLDVVETDDLDAPEVVDLDSRRGGA